MFIHMGSGGHSLSVGEHSLSVGEHSLSVGEHTNRSFQETTCAANSCGTSRIFVYSLHKK
jgi:hypothetical protein